MNALLILISKSTRSPCMDLLGEMVELPDCSIGLVQSTLLGDTCLYRRSDHGLDHLKAVFAPFIRPEIYQRIISTHNDVFKPTIALPSLKT